MQKLAKILIVLNSILLIMNFLINDIKGMLMNGICVIMLMISTTNCE